MLKPTAIKTRAATITTVEVDSEYNTVTIAGHYYCSISTIASDVIANTNVIATPAAIITTTITTITGTPLLITAIFPTTPSVISASFIAF